MSRRDRDWDEADYDDDVGARRRWPIVAAIVLLAAGVAAFVVLQRDDERTAFDPDVVTATSQGPSTALDRPSSSTTDDPDTTTGPTGSTSESTKGVAEADPDDDGDTVATEPGRTVTTGSAGSNTTNSSEATTTGPSSVPSSTAGATTTTSPGPSTTGPQVESLPPVPSTALPYPTSPDGTPLPIVAIFDTTTVTLTGQVPSEAARERLATLALANSQFPDVEIVDNLVVNPAVPLSVGVRVIELNSARFPERSAEILPDHAAELNRVVSIMQALPNISVVVVGHADQRGSELSNFAISDARAGAVVNYLLFLGISPSRLSSRAVGSSDLLTSADDATALALNRRTEFIFYGLLLP